jgi:hypothetical protein
MMILSLRIDSYFKTQLQKISNHIEHKIKYSNTRVQLELSLYIRDTFKELNVKL